jgi:hypothetical protein
MAKNKESKRNPKYWELRLNEIFLKVIASHDTFSADTIYAECVRIKFPATLLSKLVANCFKSYRAAGTIVKLNNFKLSERNGSSPLPLWRSKRAE